MVQVNEHPMFTQRVIFVYGEAASFAVGEAMLLLPVDCLSEALTIFGISRINFNSMRLV